MSKKKIYHYEKGSDPYKKIWNPKTYLNQYYTTDHIAEDELTVIKFTIEVLREINTRFQQALEFGCGPTVHHAISLIPFVQELHLADYIPENLDEVRKWLDSITDAHNWDVYVKGVLQIEKNKQVKEKDVNQRKTLMRQRITQLRRCDIFKKYPLGNPYTYPLVTSYYCVESASNSKAGWKRNMGHLANLIEPGGYLILSALRNAKSYHVGECKDVEIHLPTIPIDEDDIAIVLKETGFDDSSIDIRVAFVLEWKEEGFDSIIVAKARKKPS